MLSCKADKTRQNRLFVTVSQAQCAIVLVDRFLEFDVYCQIELNITID